MWQYFAVAAALENVPARAESPAKGSVVVKLTVVDSHDLLVLAKERLMAAGWIDDA
jgi:hypothetical protein